MVITEKLHRLSLGQLKALRLVAQSKGGVVSSAAVGKKIGIRGKALGGLFSSLARQKIDKKPLILAWGRAPDGPGLRWRLNRELISRQELLKIINPILEHW